MAKVFVDVSVDVDAWQALLPDPVALASRAFDAVAAVLGAELPGSVEISLVYAGDPAVRILNREHRGRDRPTNVLSFPLEAPGDGHGETPAMIGDIVLAAETVAREAAEQGKTVDSHVCHLLIHGMLHLVGYDHEQDDDAEEMERLEIAALGRLGIDDPYAVARPPAGETAAAP